MEPLRIEFVGEASGSDTEGRTYIIINGHPAIEARYLDLQSGEIAIEVEDLALTRLLGTYPLLELRNYFRSISIVSDPIEAGVIDHLFVGLRQKLISLAEPGRPLIETSYVRLHFSLAVDIAEWASAWTPRDYGTALEATAAAKAIGGLDVETDPYEGFGFDCEARSLNHTLAEEIDFWIPILNSIHEEATALLISTQNANSITTSFDFPPQVQGACEQYLTYFAQFLRELGIEATTDLQHEETTVLFSVTPKEKEQALEQIWRALAVYLQLPTSPTLDLAAAQSTDVRFQQLAGMVQYYNAQLTLGRAAARSAEIDLRAQAREIQALERESEAQQLVIAEQRTLLQQQARAMESANVLLDSMKSVSKGGEVVDKEEFLGGVVALGTMEEKGVSINWAEGWRRLKRWVSEIEEDKDGAG